MKLNCFFQKFASNCDEDIQIVKLKAAEKQLVVDLHNFFRDKIANGDQPLFPVNKCSKEIHDLITFINLREAILNFQVLQR